jgi:hypothetical protein
MILEVALSAFLGGWSAGSTDAADAHLACGGPLVALFTPARPSLGHYEVCTSDRSQEDIRLQGGLTGPKWAPIETVEALDAFGAAGSYRRAALAQLYGGARVQVSHGWLETGDQFESLTLLSPYPDPSLTRLISGTLVIRYLLLAGAAGTPSRWKTRAGDPAPPPARIKRDSASGPISRSLPSLGTRASRSASGASRPVHRAAVILMSPFTTSRDITGSPEPIVASAKRGPNLSALVRGRSEVMVPFKVTARIRAFPGRRGNRT